MSDALNDLITTVRGYAEEEEEGGMWHQVLTDLQSNTSEPGRIAHGVFQTLGKRNSQKLELPDLSDEDRIQIRGFIDFALQATQTIQEVFGLREEETHPFLVVRKERE